MSSTPVPPLSIGGALCALLIGQFALMGSGVLVIAGANLAGIALTGGGGYSVLPLVIVYTVAALSAGPAFRLMRRRGGRAGFAVGAAFGGACGSLCFLAVLQSSFRLYCVALGLWGVSIAFGQYYRFSIVALVDFEQRTKAVSLLLLSGLAGIAATPYLVGAASRLAGLSSDAAVFLTVGTLSAISFASFSLSKGSDFRERSEPIDLEREPRPEASFLRFYLAAGAISYGAMVCVMTAAPLEMSSVGMSRDTVFLVMQLHMVSMYLPALLFQLNSFRFDEGLMVVFGVAAISCSLIIAQAEPGFLMFAFSLSVLGVGWNLTYVGSTARIATIARGAASRNLQARSEILNNASVLAGAILSGVLFWHAGWKPVNLASLCCLVLVLGIALHRDARSTRDHHGADRSRTRTWQRLVPYGRLVRSFVSGSQRIRSVRNG